MVRRRVPRGSEPDWPCPGLDWGRLVGARRGPVAHVGTTARVRGGVLWVQLGPPAGAGEAWAEQRGCRQGAGSKGPRSWPKRAGNKCPRSRPESRDGGAAVFGFGGKEVAQVVGGVVAAVAVFVGIDFEDVFEAVGIVLEYGECFGQTGAAFVDEEAGPKRS
jgi:hypothetical protein